ncbi:cytochrome P450 2K4 [Maylandia zebra]|uniref:Cytochrome P450 2K4 n=1 Tax=Maylandia zebra TaxID=106582 RepID=A0A3P9C501_9CICH|nr:cytochrome P450 2K4 [Maylandia zebra]
MDILYVFLQGIYSIVLCLTVLLLIHCLFSNITQKDGKEPPGPTPYPIFGNFPQLYLKKTHVTLLELSKQFGSIFTIYLGTKKVVVLVGYNAVKEALVDYAEVFGERDLTPIIDEHFQGHGIVWANDDTWKEMRRFSMINLKDFGMGKKEFEDKIIEECHYLMEAFKQFKGEFDVKQSLNNATANISCSLIYGNRFDYNDLEFTSLVHRTCRNTTLLSAPSVQLYNMVPWIGKWFSYPNEFKKAFAANREQQRKLVSHLKETLDPKMCRGFVDAFLIHQDNLEKSGITTSHFHNENLLITIMNLFVAGTETSARTVTWGLFLMAKYPKIQEKVREELSSVVGNRQVQFKDRTELPFTNAVIHETQRLTAVAALGLPHRTSQDITFRGHFIKKGTAVYPFLFSVLSDESKWEKPYTFYPEHFLDKDGKFIQRDAFMVFSAGRRVCPGANLARTEVFIFFTTLLQHFRITFPPGVSEDELLLSPSDSLILNPSNVKLCAVPL